MKWAVIDVAAWSSGLLGLECDNAPDLVWVYSGINSGKKSGRESGGIAGGGPGNLEKPAKSWRRNRKETLGSFVGST